MFDVTVVIPIGPQHEAIAERAIASVQAQTVATALIEVHDQSGNGAGWARNQGLAQVTTDYVVFLDADDYLEPTFVERALASRQKFRYLYTDWYEDGAVKSAPDKPWCGGTWHIITTLIPTQWVRQLGGFDEQLPGAEDTDFYLKLATARLCGQHLAEPLVHYTKDGGRGRAFVTGPDHDRVMQEITRRYTGKMGCCGGGTQNLPPAGERQPGDVLVFAIWGGNQRLRGRATGRMYPRTGNGKQLWIDPRDLAAMPDKFAAVVEPAVDDPLVLDGVAAFANAVMREAQPLAADVPPSPVVQPNVAQVLRLARR